MKKNFITKLFIALIVSATFLLLITNYNVEATSSKSYETLEEEERIMEYDSITGETREVNIEELRQITTMLESKSGENSYSTSPYIPYKTKILAKSQFSSSITTFASGVSADRITDTSSFPNLTTCQVSFTASDGKTTKYCTAALIGPNIALTSAHCIFNANNEKFANWTVKPGYNDGVYYGQKCGWSRVYYSSKWMNDNHNDEYDWAICVLEKDLGNQVGWFGIQSYGSNSEMNNIAVTVLGYPIDKNYGYDGLGRYQYKTGEKITSTYDRFFVYKGYTVEGFSGGPIMRDSDNYIIGVHFGGNLNTNNCVGIRITQDMINLIKNLKGEG